MGWRFYVTRVGDTLVPVSRSGQIAIEKLKFGVPYEIGPKRPRNTKQNNLFWAFMTHLANSLNAGPTRLEWTPDELKSDLLCATGRSRDRAMTKRERARHGVSNDELFAAAERLETLASAILEKGPEGIEKIAHAIRSEAEKLKRIEAVGIIARPVSTNFASMSGDEFSAFMDDAMVYVRDQLAPWIDGSDEWPEIEKILATSWMLRGEDKGGDK